MKCIAIIPEDQIHCTDHLAVMASIMQIPLIYFDEKQHELTKKYYPDVVLSQCRHENANPRYFIQNCDVMFTGDLWEKAFFEKQFGALEKKFKKQMRRVFCPHGFSDKLSYFKMVKGEDICLIYGQNMRDMLDRADVLKSIRGWVITGNYRYTYYKKHQEFYEALVQKEILSRFSKKRKTILYAPTWQDYENSTTFFDYYSEILGKLPEDFNLIVKLHPHLETFNPVDSFQIMGKFEKNPRIVFTREFIPVYPILAHADLYIGDMSSVGYDFLTFNRPMFFLNKFQRDPETDPRVYLYRSGVNILPDQFPKLFQIIEKHLISNQEHLSKIRDEMYKFTFAPEQPFENIRQNILNTVQSTQ